MRFSLKLIENTEEISNKILQALLSDVTKYMDNGISIIKNQLPQIIRNSLTNSSEYSSLLNGELRYEFGIPDPGVKLAGLLDIWCDNIQYSSMKPTIVSNKIKAIFTANTIRIDYADVLYTDYALVIDSTRGYSLPWLEWLLLEGNKTIIDKYEVIIGPNQYSRTGNALMKPSNKPWKVPSTYAGTASDNWITRAIDSVTDDIENLLKKAFQS
jgi:hypothetical protein